MRILIVEDSPTQAAALAGVLEDCGYQSAIAQSGEEALARLEEEDFALVLSDIVMPGMTGFALCRKIKDSARGRVAGTPVLLLTSLRDPLDVVRALESGADNFLTKPVEPQQLQGRIRMMLASREVRLEGRSQFSVELEFLGRRFVITTERQQLLDLLVATFEELVVANGRLRVNEEELADAQERLAAQLRTSDGARRRVAALLDALPEGVLVADSSGRVTDASRPAIELLGMARDEILEARLEDLLSSAAGRALSVRCVALNNDVQRDGTMALLGRPDAVSAPVARPTDLPR